MLKQSLLFLLLIIINVGFLLNNPTSAQVVYKNEGASIPIHFAQVIDNLKHQIEYVSKFNSSFLFNLKEEFFSDFKEFVMKTLDDIIVKTHQENSLGLTSDCNDQLNQWFDGLKQKEKWALQGNF